MPSTVDDIYGQARSGSCRWKRLRLFFPLLLACIYCDCGIDENGLFPPPVLHLLVPTPSLFGLVYEDIKFEASDGRQIYGWFIPSNDHKATVLIHHGALINRSSTFSQYNILHDLGYDVMVYDYRGFGESRETANLQTILEDADTALSYLLQRDKTGEGRVILFGVSMGTLPAIAQAGSSEGQIAGVILEGSFLPELLPPWSLLLAGITPWVNPIDRVPRELDPNQYIGSATMPKLFLHSRRDLVTPYESAQDLFQEAPGPKQFVDVLGQHTLAALVDPNYALKIETFLDGVVSTTLDASESIVSQELVQGTSPRK